MPEPSIISINNLSGGYYNYDVLKNIQLQIEPSSMTAIIGPNGCGKTTLLKYLTKELSKNKESSIYICNKEIEEYKDKQLAMKVSLVSQLKKQEYGFTVKEIVSLGRYCHDDINDNNPEVENAIKAVGIESIENKLITELSGGEFQMVMLARAVCQQTEIILLDEPNNNLDPKNQIEMMTLLTKLIKQNKTIICVMHDLNMVLRYFNNTIVMKEGKIYRQGKTSEVITSSILNDVYQVKADIIPAHDRLPATVYYNL